MPENSNFYDGNTFVGKLSVTSFSLSGLFDFNLKWQNKNRKQSDVDFRQFEGNIYAVITCKLGFHQTSQNYSLYGE